MLKVAPPIAALIAMMPILVFERNLYAWNIATRRMEGESEWFPGAPSDWIRNFGISKADLACIEDIFDEDQSGQPFYLPFIPLFPSGTLSNALPREQKRCQVGAYTFNVMYETDTWRKLKLPGAYTMDDLHHNILLSYDFEDNHLYSFFMDNKKWSNNCIASPNDDLGHADASKVHIDRNGFVKGQQFLYVFDYGAEWTFRVTVEEIDEQDTNDFTPQLVDEKGPSPKQYFDEDWDEDDEDDEEDRDEW
ncbi:plasmid pRiA4b ORF-3 family protein [Sporosarcina koreensis]|uniref:plasmid pRiA4b ORF-3 family protein n=1 Tax=Sporosarcina koreensis TaxID=334735 RepID=UPI000A615E76|nr:plasmid pRiA4b ORF-3 family protein [Sporosarcina koreensis]